MNYDMFAAATADQRSTCGSKAATSDIYANCFRDPDYEFTIEASEEYADYFSRTRSCLYHVY